MKIFIAFVDNRQNRCIGRRQPLIFVINIVVVGHLWLRSKYDLMVHNRKGNYLHFT